MNETEAAGRDTLRMTGCSSCGMYMVLKGAPERNFICMKCRLIELLEEKIRGLEMQVETLAGFRRGFEQMMEHRDDEAQGISPDMQMEAGPKSSEEPLGEESGQWKHVTRRTRQRKRRASDGEIELRNRFAGLENEDGAQQVLAEGERARKKR